jgi:hypothetical protein
MRRRFPKPRSANLNLRRPAPAAPLPGAVVDAVLRYHDEAQDQGCGRTLLRLSARRLRDAEVASALGELAPRAAQVSILWNEREGEIIRVLEAPPLAA